MTGRVIFQGEYSDEELNDAIDYIFDAMKESGVPTDENGISVGTWKFTVEFIPEEV
jgi:hypothetical protein